MGDVYSFEGTLYEDPSRSGLAKSLFATVSGQGTEEDPVIASIKTAYAEGEPKHCSHRGSGKGLLTPDANYEFQLQQVGAQNEFVGELPQTYMFNYGPNGPIRFMWKPAQELSKRMTTQNAQPASGKRRAQQIEP